MVIFDDVQCGRSNYDTGCYFGSFAEEILACKLVIHVLLLSDEV